MDKMGSGQLQQSMHAAIRERIGDVDLNGFELLRLVKTVANLYEVVGDEHLRAADVSGPRLRLLLRLWGEEVHGNMMGTSPTHLSRCENVSKNTVSALLRGLEEQGLIERALDDDDRRVFHIRLTAAGRRLVQDTAPEHLIYLNRIADGLTEAERAQLAGLLETLRRSLARHVGVGPTAA
jgi:DNA-binding MarR family transcriptional regulator